MNIALVLSCFNRSDLLKQTLDSLSINDLSLLSCILIHDDNSTEKEVFHYISEFVSDNKKLHIQCIFSNKNKGIKGALLTSYDYLFYSGAEIIINLDSDAICKPNFITELLRLKSEHPDNIISGFNCNHPKNPVIGQGEEYVLRNHCNGINMLIDKRQYEEIIRPALLAQGNWDYSATHSKPFVVARPSLVQHIGANQSSMGHTHGDVACDFKLLSLPQVSLFGIDAHDPEGIKRAADICTRDVEFAGVKIITERLFSGREAYSKFMIQDLWQHVQDLPGTHILTIHPDGYIVNPNAWQDEFLEYDFTGATWWYKDGMNCGNGGFSLRSKKLIKFLSEIPEQSFKAFHPEDDVICRQIRPYLEDNGLKFAPDHIANKFSIEAYAVPHPHNVYSGQFGFHGFHVTGLPIPPKRPKAVNPTTTRPLKPRTMGIPRKRF